jgi:two-component system, OmpR family, response regulator NblR
MNSVLPDSTPCVLLVETDESLANHVSLDLKESGYDIVMAPDAVGGLRQATATAFVDRGRSHVGW